MKRGLHSSGAIFLQFALVAFGFVAATIYTEYHHLSQFDEQLLGITKDALLSVEHLTAARTELRHLEESLGDIVALAGRSGGPERWDALSRSQQRMHKELDAYMLLPAFPQEQASWPVLQERLAAVDRALDHAGTGASERPEDLRDPYTSLLLPVRAAAEGLDASLRQLTDFNMNQVQAVVGDMRGVRHTNMRRAFLLDGLNVLLALLATLLVLRTVRGHTRMMELHQQFLKDRADELEQFAGRVAHDIVNPLSTISLTLNLIGRTAEGNERLCELVGRGTAGVLRAQRIINGLLEFAKAGARPQPDARAEVLPVLEDVVSGLSEDAAEARVELVGVPADAPVAVTCSPGVLTSLLSNLMRNAIKYMGDGPVRRVTVRVHDGAAGMVRFDVEDTGAGVPPELGDSIFEPHVRAKGAGQPGIGLGLATVKRIAEAHGGNVGFRSAPGKGSLFWFELPRVVPPQKE